LYTAANNVETVYFNKAPFPSGADDLGTGPPLINTYEFVPEQGENTFDFDVSTKEANPPRLDLQRCHQLHSA
jgi:hypothetical protein